MAVPKVDDTVLDASCNEIATADRVDVCTQEPLNITEARTTYSIGNYTLVGGDYTVADGDTSGRKVSLNNNKTGNNATGSGNAVCLAWTTATVVKAVSPGDNDTLNSGSPFTVNAGKIAEFPDPT